MGLSALPEPEDGDPDLLSVLEAVGDEIVGRRREITGILAAVSTGRDLVLEGPPGTGKSTMLRSITQQYGIPLFLVEGNSDLTPAKMIGYHNPAQVLKHGYRSEDFVPGPLCDAMQQGGFLYVEEFNRVPEETLNALLGAMAEREIHVPRVGLIRARPTFRVIASMNPFDNVGTSRVSMSVYDRLCRLAVDYQDAEEECDVVARRTGSERRDLIETSVGIVRATREHPSAIAGSSIRGAIDLVLIAERLAEMRAAVPGAEDAAWAPVLAEAACLALTSKVRLHDTAERTPEQVIEEIVAEVASRAR